MTLSDLPFLKTGNESITLSVYVQPRASKNEICGIQGGELKLRLTSPPVDGAANQLCREFIADFFHVPKSSVQIIAGETSRHKRLTVHCNIDKHNVYISALAETLQQAGHP